MNSTRHAAGLQGHHSTLVLRCILSPISSVLSAAALPFVFALLSRLLCIAIFTDIILRSFESHRNLQPMKPVWTLRSEVLNACFDKKR